MACAKRTNLTQDELITLKESCFLFSKNHFINIFDDDAFFFVNKLMDVNAWPKN
jgi:hypothetical protein